MSDKISKFFDSVQERLETLQGRMDSLRANIGTTSHALHDKLGEVRQKNAATKQAVAEARATLERWGRAENAEARSSIDESIRSHDTQKLSARAREAEHYVGVAITIALASIDDVERTILEAIAAMREVEAATSG
jgi:DNA repair exonuclease SbcCD ATPase subunit